MPQFKNLTPPPDGAAITRQNGRLMVPDTPIIPFIEGDGVGPDIWRASVRVFDAAVRKASDGRRRVVWFEVLAGQKAFDCTGEWLPEDTVEAVRAYRVAIKGPLTTPVGGGIRSLNVALRQILDLYACVRPVRYFPGTPSPVRHPERMDVVIFRENTEDIYAGIEWESGSQDAARVIEFLSAEMGQKVRADSGIGIKPVSVTGSQRLVRMAIRHALDNDRGSVTLVHKGNIMKFTEGAFRDWGYELARTEFGDRVVTEDEAPRPRRGRDQGPHCRQHAAADPDPHGRVRRHRHDQPERRLPVGCLCRPGGRPRLAPGANIGDEVGFFEATHGTAPKYAGRDMINPSSVMLSGAMMFRHLGWREVAGLIEDGIGRTIQARTVTYDLERLMDGARKLSTSAYADAIIANM